MIGTVFAQITNPSIGGLTGSVGEGGVGFLGDLLRVIVSILFIVGGVYFFFQILTGGIAWIGSGGDKAKLGEAREKVLHAGIGLILLFAAFAIITLVENVFGVGILNFNVPIIGQDAGGTITCVGGSAGCPSGCPFGQSCVCYSPDSCFF